jgi:hypothetical protein
LKRSILGRLSHVHQNKIGELASLRTTASQGF